MELFFDVVFVVAIDQVARRPEMPTTAASVLAYPCGGRGWAMRSTSTGSAPSATCVA